MNEQNPNVYRLHGRIMLAGPGLQGFRKFLRREEWKAGGIDLLGNEIGNGYGGVLRKVHDRDHHALARIDRILTHLERAELLYDFWPELYGDDFPERGRRGSTLHKQRLAREAEAA